MSEYESLRAGNSDETFVLTRRQLRQLADIAFRSGSTNSEPRPTTFAYEFKPSLGDNWYGQQVARAQWLHIVTANNLRKARRTIRELRGRVDRLQDRLYEKSALVDGYRGQVARDNPFGTVPEHYLGDGYVTCDRAIESASAQRCIVDRTPLQFWYWATAMKYVWRMWSKEDPEKDALKAIDCLEKAAGIGRLVEIDGAEVVE